MKAEATCTLSVRHLQKIENELIVLVHVTRTQMQKNSVLTHSVYLFDHRTAHSYQLDRLLFLGHHVPRL